MTNMKSTKRALVSSVFALVLCFAMLLGTTYAWFTDEVTSSGNIIQTGTLDIDMSYSDNNTDWTEITENNEAVFNYEYWEPGYIDVKYVKIVNNGTLAFKFQLNIVPNTTPAAGEANLADVIDVYLFDANATVNRTAVAAATPVGTLSDLIAENDGAAHGILLPAAGKGSTDVNPDEAQDAPRGEITYCIVLKMQENAGNEYQNLTVGDGFSLQLMATQYTWENDAFDHLYDEGAEYDEAPKANVQKMGAKTVTIATEWGNWEKTDEMLLWTTLQFQPTETLEEAKQSEYRYYHADYVVYADKEVPANSITLAGFYQAFADFIGKDLWIPMANDQVTPADAEIRLVELLGVTVNYEEICQWGNDGTGFLCGINATKNDDGTIPAAGTTITVELRLYETTGDPTTESGPKNEETGKYITIGTYTYTIPGTEPIANN